MRYKSLTDFVSDTRALSGTGPIAVLMCEDTVEAQSTIRHHKKLGFAEIIILAPEQADLAETDDLHRIDCNHWPAQAATSLINTLIDAFPNRWFYYGYNSEYLFYPFCETRSIGEMLAFHSEERRNAMLTYVIDLYAPDLMAHPSAVDLETAHLDQSGYYALARQDPVSGATLDRQLNFYGGLRWRFEEHVPKERRHIGRVGLFKSKPGLRLRDDHTFSDAEYNTYACPWHNNLTAAICSFRAAKALKLNPGSRDRINNFTWHNSVPFEWDSRQLLDLGLIEPGQWF